MEIEVEIQLMEQRLTNVENKLSELESKIDGMDEKLNQVVSALVGNKLTKSDGLVQELDNIRDKIDAHDEIIKKVKYFWLGVVTIGTIIGVLVNFIFRILTK